MINIITWAIIIVGALLILISALTFKRKGEAELSSNITETPLFRVGAVVVIVGIVAKLLAMVLL